MNIRTVVKELFSFKPSVNTRYAWIDYAKGIAIILVVYRHVAFGLRNSGTDLEQWVIDLNNTLYSFRMPLFFLLSGLFFQRSVDRRGEKGYFISKVNTLLYPYILWAFIQISGQILFSGMANAQRGAGDYLNILVQPRRLDQLWYLFALFNVSWVYLVFSKLFKARPQLKYLQLPVALILLGAAVYVNQISALYDTMLHYIFFCIGNLTAGYFFSEKTTRRLSSFPLLLLLTPVFVCVQYYFLYHQDMNLYLYAVIALIGSLYTIMISLQLQRYNGMRFLKVIGHYSLYIYLLHVPIVSVLRYVMLNRIGMYNNVLLVMLLLITLSIFLSIIAYRICMLLKLGFLFKGPFKENTVEKPATAPAIPT